MSELAKLEHISGIKDATGDVGKSLIPELRNEENFIQLCGNDDIALGFNAHGERMHISYSQYCTSVIGNLSDSYEK